MPLLNADCKDANNGRPFSVFHDDFAIDPRRTHRQREQFLGEHEGKHLEVLAEPDLEHNWSDEYAAEYCPRISIG